jgi:hypothetical protein
MMSTLPAAVPEDAKTRGYERFVDDLKIVAAQMKAARAA